MINEKLVWFSKNCLLARQKFRLCSLPHLAEMPQTNLHWPSKKEEGAGLTLYEERKKNPGSNKPL
jgi:hypothetical protein